MGLQGKPLQLNSCTDHQFTTRLMQDCGINYHWWSTPEQNALRCATGRRP